jgi:hypothetical protein
MSHKKKHDPYMETAKDHPPEVYEALKDPKVWKTARGMLDRLGYGAAEAEALRMLRMFQGDTSAEETDPRLFFYLAVERAVERLHFDPDYDPLAEGKG